MIIIGIAGLKNSGKSTFAKALTKELQQNYGRVVLYAPFARPLKAVAETIFGKAAWYGTDEQKAVPAPYWADKLGEKYSSARRILQTLGTDVFRDTVSKDLWVHAQRNYLANQGALDVVIIDDCRFDNEADFIRECNGQIIHITRLGIERPKDIHASESGVAVCVADLYFNFSSIAEMAKTAKEILPQLIRKASHL